ncbi:MAG: phosphate starvation-inducible protein PhoH, partial [Pseudobutyrivibrio sp.]|nr:phosphate starvation-inducible protein PhoH [Pseudobutyrivibrio sp.]
MSDFSLSISIPAEHTGNIFGQFDKNIKAIEKGMNISFIPRDDSIKVIGDKAHVEHGIIIIDELLSLSKKGNIITTQDVNYIMSLEQEKIESHDVSEARGEIICHTTTG